MIGGLCGGLLVQTKLSASTGKFMAMEGQRGIAPCKVWLTATSLPSFPFQRSFLEKPRSGKTSKCRFATPLFFNSEGEGAALVAASATKICADCSEEQTFKHGAIFFLIQMKRMYDKVI